VKWFKVLLTIESDRTISNQPFDL